MRKAKARGPYRFLVDDRVIKELGNPQRYPAKVYRQITLKVFSLQSEPRPQDCKPIGEGYRVDSGEYRIYYEVNDDKKLVIIYWIGKRGDDEFYKELKRKGFL
ncbi:MAG: type II toxin-antitoxin system RelE/ParE family toxin [Candidatus Bipolaricaulia bacterium]